MMMDLSCSSFRSVCGTEDVVWVAEQGEGGESITVQEVHLCVSENAVP